MYFVILKRITLVYVCFYTIYFMIKKHLIVGLEFILNNLKKTKETFDEKNKRLNRSLMAYHQRDNCPRIIAPYKSLGDTTKNSPHLGWVYDLENKNLAERIFGPEDIDRKIDNLGRDLNFEVDIEENNIGFNEQTKLTSNSEEDLFINFFNKTYNEHIGDMDLTYFNINRGLIEYSKKFSNGIVAITHFKLVTSSNCTLDNSFCNYTRSIKEDFKSIKKIITYSFLYNIPRPCDKESPWTYSSDGYISEKDDICNKLEETSSPFKIRPIRDEDYYIDMQYIDITDKKEFEDFIYIGEFRHYINADRQYFLTTNGLSDIVDKFKKSVSPFRSSKHKPISNNKFICENN